ncbi:MAG: hypothetical protein KIT84_14980 [Labilithrix sp.]|nr:hypothetical protein [Labilithrix sp.]MCW5812327.1 hypothetical protein [Labilithrix sp.]
MSEYRRGAAAAAPPLTLWFVPAPWTNVLTPALFAAGVVWAASQKAGAEQLKQIVAGVLFVSFLLAIMFPVVRIHVRYEAGNVITSGRRWPGAEVTWSASLTEVRAFGVAEQPNGRRTHRTLTLDLEDNRRLGLTPLLYAGPKTQHDRQASHLNTWLDALRELHGRPSR